MSLSQQQQDEIIQKVKEFFQNTIFQKHISNTKKCNKPEEFNINPFLLNYLAIFLTGDTSPQSKAKALIYPRVLGTSINTSFGANIQKMCSEIFPETFGSAIAGIDIEFIDQLDMRRKYCQMKAGPNTINSDDVMTIKGKFRGVINLARVNNLQISTSDMVVGVLYGENSELSAFYKDINETYPVFAGKDFWHRLTGVQNFYERLIHETSTLATDTSLRDILTTTINELASRLD